MSDETLHIVVFPWLAFGHMLPFLELSKSLAKRGHRITYISTPRNIQRLPEIEPDLSPRIQFLSFPLPLIEHLPDMAESTADVPLENVRYLKKAFDGLEAPFSDFLKSACADKATRPDWVIMDFAHHWLPKITEECGVLCSFFSVFPALPLVFYGPCSEFPGGYRTKIEDFTVPPKWIPFPCKVAYRRYEAQLLVSHHQKNASDISDLERYASVLNGSNFICLRSCHNLEPEWLPLLSKIYEKDVMPVGLLPPHIDGSSSKWNTTDIGELDVMDWLDRQPAKSVLYIALGSEVTFSMKLLHELALGIEMSQVRFLWALRKPDGTTDYARYLPEGFEERAKELGVISEWVPQIRVLSHASVGGFLTHCGWSSVVENFQFAHPLVLLPMIADQGLNSQMLEQKGVGVAIPRDEETGNFSRDEVAKLVCCVMVEEQGKFLRSNAKQLKEIFTDRNAHEKHIDAIVEKVKKLKQDAQNAP